jgi:hypothetical protein
MGKEKDVLKRCVQVKDVTEGTIVFGEYDLIVKIMTDDVKDSGKGLRRSGYRGPSQDDYALLNAVSVHFLFLLFFRRSEWNVEEAQTVSYMEATAFTSRRTGPLAVRCANSRRM